MSEVGSDLLGRLMTTPDEPQTYRCRAGTEGQRCSFHGTRDELRDHADEMGHPRCIICTDALAWHETQTCDRDVQRVRADLDAVAAAFAHLERVIGQAAYHGIAWNALTLVGDGAVTGGGPDDHVRYDDPAPAIAVLEQHDRDWREEFNHPRPPYHPLGHADRETAKQLLGNVLEYLRTHHRKAAAEHRGFDDYATEIRQLRSRLEHVVGLADDPVRAPAQCFDCAGQLVRTYAHLIDTEVIHEHDCAVCERRHAGRHGKAAEGLTDDWTCRACGRVYDQASYFLALRAAKDSCQGWVPIQLAATVLRIPASTLFRWASRGEVETVRENGRTFVEWSEVSVLREERAS